VLSLGHRYNFERSASQDWEGSRNLLRESKKWLDGWSYEILFFLVELQQMFSNNKFIMCANKLSMEGKGENCHEEII
jgi:hypothetical protein